MKLSRVTTAAMISIPPVSRERILKSTHAPNVQLTLLEKSPDININRRK
jgi:hypothetical protein